MTKMHKENRLLEVKNLPSKVVESIRVTLEILNENYGTDRNVDNDLGGYVLIAENIVDIEMLKQDKLQGIMSEYTDVIECSEGVNLWIKERF